MIFQYFTNRTKKLSKIVRRRPNVFPKSWCSLKKRSSLGISLIFCNFGPQIKLISKKKSFYLNLVHYFLQFIIVAALKFLTLPKFFISLPEKFEFCPNFGNLGNSFPFPPPPGTAIRTNLLYSWENTLCHFFLLNGLSKLLQILVISLNKN